MTHRDGTCGCTETIRAASSISTGMQTWRGCTHGAWHETLVEHYGPDQLSKCHMCKQDREEATRGTP